MDGMNNIKTFMTGSSKIKWNSMACKSGSPTPAAVQNHLQSNQALSFIKWGCMLSCCMEWDFPSII